MIVQEQEFFEWIAGKGFQLTDIQKQAVKHDQGPLLLLAVPGAGKTTVLTVRLAYLILVKHAIPERILCLTFGRAAAHEMRERFRRNFGERVNGRVHFSTIHSYALEIVRTIFNRQGRTFRLIDEGKGADSKTAVLRRLYEKINSEIPNEDQLDELQNTICFIKNRMIGPDRLKKVAVKNLAAIFAAYEKYKSNHLPQLIDFDDMLAMAYASLKDNPTLLSSYRQRFTYILTDESQDTSLLQHKLIEIVAQPKGNIFVVGDDDQSIYGFRAAEPGYLLDFAKVYKQAKVQRMEENFRSTPQIVDVAGRFIKANKQRYDKAMFTGNSGGEPVKIKQFKSLKEQYAYIRQELLADKALDKTAVLFRNNLSTIRLADELDHAHIPFYVRESGTEKFFRHWAVNDILNYLRFSYNDRNMAVLEKIWTKLEVHLSKSQMASLLELGVTRSVFDMLAAQPNVPAKRKKAYFDLKCKFQELNSLPPLKAIQYIRHTMNYDQAVERICSRLGFSQEYVQNLLGMLEVIAARTSNLVEFANRLNYLEEVIKTSAKNQGHNAVTLTTIHSAKGLEWDKVYLIDLLEGIIPDRQASEVTDGGQAGLEEERRLFYVGMTRARQQLTLCAPSLHFMGRDGASSFVLAVCSILAGKETVEPKAEQGNSSGDELGAGLVVIHRRFGEGVIIREQANVLTVRFFRDNRERSFMRDICVRDKLLWAK